ncbi:hypothetical protein PRIPAC_72670 [Pristionchus pacificus]|nr:hypothetical protein PRIPAC_72670 [Pristionchus pacificus]
MPHSQSIPSHVIENVEFFCGPTSQVALDALPCISGSLLKSRHCSSSLLGIMPSSAHEKKCASLVSLFDCSRDKMDAECGEGTLITLAASINAFGCTIKGFDEKVAQLLRYIQEELKKMRLGDEDLQEGSAYDDIIEGTPILFEDDQSLQTVKETRSINVSLIPHTVGANLTGIPIHASQYSSPEWMSMGNDSDPFLPPSSSSSSSSSLSSLSNSSHFPTIECSIVQEEFLKDCYSELADRTSDWAAPLPIHIFSLSTAEIRDLCEDYRRTTENCLGPHFDLNCTGSLTVNTMDNRIGTMCTASLSQSFTEDFECLRRVTTLQGCESVSSPLPSGDCSSSPEFLCYSRRSLVECSPDAFDLFISTVFTLGCHKLMSTFNGDY